MGGFYHWWPSSPSISWTPCLPSGERRALGCLGLGAGSLGCLADGESAAAASTSSELMAMASAPLCTLRPPLCRCCRRFKQSDLFYAEHGDLPAPDPWQAKAAAVPELPQKTGGPGAPAGAIVGSRCAGLWGRLLHACFLNAPGKGGQQRQSFGHGGALKAGASVSPAASPRGRRQSRPTSRPCRPRRPMPSSWTCLLYLPPVLA